MPKTNRAKKRRAEKALADEIRANVRTELVREGHLHGKTVALIPLPPEQIADVGDLANHLNANGWHGGDVFTSEIVENASAIIVFRAGQFVHLAFDSSPHAFAYADVAGDLNLLLQCGALLQPIFGERYQSTQIAYMIDMRRVAVGGRPCVIPGHGIVPHAYRCRRCGVPEGVWGCGDACNSPDAMGCDIDSEIA